MNTIYISQKAVEPIADSHRVSTDEKKTCQDATEAIRQSRTLSTQSDSTIHRPFVATARRVPWRRLQIEDMEGVIEWNAPDYVPL